MAIVRIVKDLYPGWRVGDHVEVDGVRVKEMVEEGGCVVVEEDVLPVVEDVEETPVVSKKKGVKHGRKN